MPKVRFWRLQLLAGAFIVGIVGVVVLSSFSDITGSIFLRTTEARQGTLETAFTGSGLMVRSEIAVQAPTDGVVTLLVEDSQRVRAGQIVAEVRQENTAQVSEALSRIDGEIASLDREAQRLADEMRRRIDGITNDIRSMEAELASALAAGSATMAEEYGSTIDQLYKELERLEQEFAMVRSEREQERAALFEERSTVLRDASANAVRVLADEPGVVSFAFDGFEGVYTPGQAPDALWNALSEQPVLQSITDASPVRAGQTLFKLIDNFVSYVFVAFSEAPGLTQGQTVWLRWPEGAPGGVRARVLSVHNRIGQVGVWFEIEVYQELFGSIRILPEVTVVTRSVSGVVVPRSALHLRNDRPGIYMVADGSPIFRYVSVHAADDTHAVVEPVPVGTPVVTNPRRLDRDVTPY